MAHAISGNVGLAGANVQWIGLTGGSQVGHATADGSGNFTTGSTLPDGNYEITPWASGYAFTPGSSFQTVASADITGVSFSASVIGTSGVWIKQGIVIPPTTSDLNGGSPTSGTQEPTVIYEGNPQILPATNVFKMWFAGGINVYYAESLDGLSWTRNPTACVTNFGNPRVFKNGSTYYLYGAPPTAGTQISVYTSSDGVTFTLAQATGLAPGGVGAWDHAAVWDMSPVYVDGGGTWYGTYTGQHSPASPIQYSTGYITSTDGLNWTRGSANPVLLNVFNVNVHQIGGTFYAWGQTALFLGNPSQPFAIPTEMGRSSSTDLINWTPMVNVLQRTLINEGFGSNDGQTGTDPCLVEANGRTYAYYSTTATGVTGTGFHLQCAIANKTLAQLVATSEGAFSVPNTLAVAHTTNAGTLSNVSSTVLPAIATTTGNLIAVAVRVAPSTSVSGITDTAGNTYTGLTDWGSTTSQGTQFWYAKNITGNAANIITVNYAAPQATAVFVWEISGADTTSPLDAQAGFFTASAVATITSSAFSTTTANEIILAAVQSFAVNQVMTANSGYVLDSAGYPAGAGNKYAGAQHLIVTSTQSGITSAMVTNPGNGGSIGVVTFKQASSSNPSATGWMNRERRFVNKRG